MITGWSSASPVIPHLKNPPNEHQTVTIPVSPQWTFGGICCGSAEASTLCPACRGLCVALASLAPLKNFSSTKVSLGVFGFYREPHVNPFFFFGCTAVKRHCFEKSPSICFFTRHHSPCQLIHTHTICSAVVQNVFFVVFLLMFKGTNRAAFSVNHLPSFLSLSFASSSPSLIGTFL